MADIKKIAAVIVTFNRKELLFQCIDCLENQTVGKPDILVIDNASTDGTGEDLVQLVRSGRINYFNTNIF